MTEDDWTSRMRALNGVTLDAAQAAAARDVALGINATIEAGARERITLADAPWSFATLCASFTAPTPDTKAKP
ncbi:hypothetical protein [Roseixanthobacter glucoisosaccharinicivorans]|uniref:hypothetical protein n=1 Tax=Roseixanthobacter glucoisosaccharinicivorans TaxID=3119923 RepID=UPI00372706A4